MNARGIAGCTVGEARHRSGEPGRWGRTRILHQFGVYWMLKGPLPFAVVVEAELVDGTVIQRPRVGNVPLLETFSHDASESRDIRAGQLKERKGLHVAVVVEIVVDAEILLFVDLVIDFDSELVAANRFGRNRLNRIAAVGGRGHELQNIHGSWIHTGQWNLIRCENARIGCCLIRLRRWQGDRCTERLHATGPVVQGLSESVAGNGAAKPAGVSKICEGLGSAGALGQGGHGHHRRWDALTNAPALIRRKKEGAIFFDGAAESSAKLILVELRLDRVEISLRV